MEGKDRGKATIVMLICALGWSLGGICIKMISWNPLVIIGFRSLIAGAMLFAYMKKSRMRFVINKYSIIIGVALSSTMALYVFANKMTTAANAIVLQMDAAINNGMLFAFVTQISREQIMPTISQATITFFLENFLTSGPARKIMAMLTGSDSAESRLIRFVLPFMLYMKK